MADLGRVSLILTANSSGLLAAMEQAKGASGRMAGKVEADLRAISGQAGQTQSALGRMAEIAGGITLGSVSQKMASSLWDTGKAAVKLAADLEQSKIGFTGLLGSAQLADTMLSQLRDFAEKTPFTFVELQDAARRMMALGFAAGEIIPTLTTVGDAAGQLGLGAEGIQRITLALGQMRAKGVVSGEEMRQLAEAGIPAWQSLAKTLGTDVATAMKKVEERGVSAQQGVSAIMAGMQERFGGGMAAQAQSLTGLWSNLEDKSQAVLGRIGDGFIKAFDLKGVVTGATESLDIMDARLEATGRVITGVAGRLSGWGVMWRVLSEGMDRALAAADTVMTAPEGGALEKKKLIHDMQIDLDNLNDAGIRLNNKAADALKLASAAAASPVSSGALGAAKTLMEQLGVSLDFVRKAGEALKMDQSEIDRQILALGGTMLDTGQIADGYGMTFTRIAAAYNAVGVNGAAMVAKLREIQDAARATAEQTKAWDEAVAGIVARTQMGALGTFGGDAAEGVNLAARALADLKKAKLDIGPAMDALNGQLARLTGLAERFGGDAAGPWLAGINELRDALASGAIGAEQFQSAIGGMVSGVTSAMDKLRSKVESAGLDIADKLMKGLRPGGGFGASVKRLVDELTRTAWMDEIKAKLAPLGQEIARTLMGGGDPSGLIGEHRDALDAIIRIGRRHGRFATTEAERRVLGSDPLFGGGFGAPFGPVTGGSGGVAQQSVTVNVQPGAVVIQGDATPEVVNTAAMRLADVAASLLSAAQRNALRANPALPGAL